MTLLQSTSFVAGALLLISCGDRKNDFEVRNGMASETTAKDWPFDQAENVAAITTRQVIDEAKPILMVIHYSDDDSWAFLCNTTGEESEGRVIGMGEALNLDSSLRSIANLQPGWIAERDSVDGEWRRQQSSEH